jgi:type IV pilus assembly protein PilZ
VRDHVTKDDTVTEPPPSQGGSNRRAAARFDVTWSVDCETEETFLYASITNISEVGIFVRTNEPLEAGTRLTLRFAPPGTRAPFVLEGVVQWVNPVLALAVSPNPGMGVRFVDLSAEDRERLVDAIRTIAYVRDSSN